LGFFIRGALKSAPPKAAKPNFHPDFAGWRLGFFGFDSPASRTNQQIQVATAKAGTDNINGDAAGDLLRSWP
jgi:hypothetical protein